MTVYRCVAIVLAFGFWFQPGPGRASTAPPVHGTAKFQIKIPKPPAAIAGLVRVPRPQYISPGTKSVVVLTDGRNPIARNVDPATGTITVILHPVVGIHTFTVTAYDQYGGVGNKLSGGTTAPVNVPPTGGATVYLSLSGVIAGVRLVLDPAIVTIGSRAVVNLHVLLTDPDGYTVLALGGTPLARPFTLTTSDPANGMLSRTAITTFPNYGPTNDVIGV